MTPEIQAYAAGVIDSDGTIQLTRRKTDGMFICSLRVSVSQVTEIIPLWFSRNFGGKVYKFQQSKKNRQAIYRWTLESEKAKDFLVSVMPFLILKSERAKCGLDYQETVGSRGLFSKLTENDIEKRIECFNNMKFLNSKSSRVSWMPPELMTRERG